jgi:hypothetical protein
MLPKLGTLKFSVKAGFQINLWSLKPSFLVKLLKEELKLLVEHAFWSLDYYFI